MDFIISYILINLITQSVFSYLCLGLGFVFVVGWMLVQLGRGSYQSLFQDIVKQHSPAQTKILSLLLAGTVVIACGLFIWKFLGGHVEPALNVVSFFFVALLLYTSLSRKKDPQQPKNKPSPSAFTIALIVFVGLGVLAIGLTVLAYSLGF